VGTLVDLFKRARVEEVKWEVKRNKESKHWRIKESVELSRTARPMPTRTHLPGCNRTEERGKAIGRYRGANYFGNKIGVRTQDLSAGKITGGMGTWKRDSIARGVGEKARVKKREKSGSTRAVWGLGE